MPRPSPKSRNTSPYHLHLETDRRRASLFHMTEADWQAAAQRHRMLARKIHITVGNDGDILDTALATADLLVTNCPPPRDNLRRRAPNLQWIQMTSAGVDAMLPFDWLPQDIALTNNQGAHGDKACDTVAMALLMLQQRMPETFMNQQARQWQPLYTTPIAGRTAVILGFGDLGQGAGRAARRLGLKVIAVTRSGKAHKLAHRTVRTARLDSVLPQADFVVVTTPLTADTRGLVSRARLDLLKPGAGFINIGRAPVVDYTALREKLESGALSGAVLDVFEQEPLPADSPWWTTRNTLVLPHISCDDPRYIPRLLDSWFVNFERWLSRRKLLNLVDRKLGY